MVWIFTIAQIKGSPYRLACYENPLKLQKPFNSYEDFFSLEENTGQESQLIIYMASKSSVAGEISDLLPEHRQPVSHRLFFRDKQNNPNFAYPD